MYFAQEVLVFQLIENHLHAVERGMFKRAFTGKRKAISEVLEVEYGLLEELKDRQVITDQHFKHLKVNPFSHVDIDCACLCLCLQEDAWCVMP